MSKEFEEIGLKKLDKVDTTEKLIQEVVLKKLEKLDKLEERTVNTEKMVQEISTELKNTQKELKSTQEGLENLTDKFTVFDYEINRKIDSLFDAFSVNREKDLVHEKDINSLDEKVFNHNIRNSNLEDKILIA